MRVDASGASLATCLDSSCLSALPYVDQPLHSECHVILVFAVRPTRLKSMEEALNRIMLNGAIGYSYGPPPKPPTPRQPAAPRPKTGPSPRRPAASARPSSGRSFLDATQRERPNDSLGATRDADLTSTTPLVGSLSLPSERAGARRLHKALLAACERSPIGYHPDGALSVAQLANEWRLLDMCATHVRRGS